MKTRSLAPSGSEGGVGELKGRRVFPENFVEEIGYIAHFLTEYIRRYLIEVPAQANLVHF